MKKLSLIAILGLIFATPAAAEDPYAARNDSWISLRGTVVSSTPSSFELDYGEGIVTVEMDDWDWYGDAYGIIAGDEVTVYGKVDDDLYETTSIEAASVHVKDLNTYFYASAADEEDVLWPFGTTLYVDTDLQLSGEVTDISGREFTLDTGNRKIQVDTSAMYYNPLDDKGYQQINEGDHVQVSGDLDSDLFERTELMAEFVTTIVKDEGKQNAES